MIEFTRQLDMVNLERLAGTPITIIGAGAVGSFTALALAKMGASDLTVFDPDSVEPHNLPNQFYRLQDLGKAKVEALGEIIRDYAGVEIKARPEKFGDQPLSGIVIAAVDGMEERKLIWRQVRQSIQVMLFIDTRMGSEVARLYAVNPLTDGPAYARTLYPSREAIQEPCTRRAISYTALGLAALTCGKVKKFLQNQPFHPALAMDFRLGHLMALL